jgi:hypothetical protein
VFKVIAAHVILVYVVANSTVTLIDHIYLILSVSSASSGTSTSLNFCQLEENINKWTLELEEQEKLFMNQATQVNAWDRLLIGNGEKVSPSFEMQVNPLIHVYNNVCSNIGT